MLSKPLLEAEYRRVMEASNAKINAAKSLALISDGWKSIRGEAIVNFILVTPSPVYLKTVVPGERREKGEYIAEEM